MKKYIIGLVLAFVPFITHAQAAAGPQIDDYQTQIVVNRDSSLNITETIDYNFGLESSHGIYRDIPVKYSRGVNAYDLRITQIQVTDGSGQPYKFSISHSGSNLRVKIGDPDVLLSGVHIFKIGYTVGRALNYFPDHDELYWNAVGANWDVPIQKASAQVVLPATVNQSQIQSACYKGVTGATSADCTAVASGNTVSFATGEVLPGENFTIVTGWPKGVVTAPSDWQKLWDTIRDNLIYLLPLVVFILMFLLWEKYGRDPKSALPVVAQYEAPDHLTPSELGFLERDSLADHHIVADLIYLATQGYLQIERIPKQGMFGSDDYKLTKLRPETELTNAFDKNLLKHLFDMGSNEVLLSSLRSKAKISKNSFLPKLLSGALVEKGYYSKDPTAVRMQYMVSGGLMVFLLVYILGHFLSGASFIAIIISIGIFFLFGWLMPRKTQKGADTSQLGKGLKLYLSVAEKDRLDFHNDPAKDPKVFEKLLPYAIAYDVSKQWAKKFEGLFDYQPSWYSDPAHAYFNSWVFYNSLNGFNTSFRTAVVQAGSAAGRGHSGFGGGGFSGGGFGGGGGGRW